MKKMDLTVLLPILAGWVAGWVINYLADTLPRTRRFSRPACAGCGNEYEGAAYLAFLACPRCGRRRGPRPWIVQASMLAVSLYTWFRPHSMGYALGMILLTYFAVVIVIDLEHRLILHPTSLAGALLGFGIGAWVHGVRAALLGALAGFVTMLGFYYLGVLFSKLRARRLRKLNQEVDAEEALGAGDVILAGILGLVLGWPAIWYGLLLGILLGGLIGALLILSLVLSGRYGKQALMVFIPYGPFFVLSAFFILFLPNWIAHVALR